MKINDPQTLNIKLAIQTPQVNIPLDGSNLPNSNHKVSQQPVNAAEKNMDALNTIYSEKDLKRLGIIECETCANRTYVDGSDDPGVSFKTPTQLDPNEAASMVMAHEMEHVVNEQANARAEDKDVISQSVTIHTSICPECGISYVAGGVTKTTTKKKTDYGLSNEMNKGLKVDDKG